MKYEMTKDAVHYTKKEKRNKSMRRKTSLDETLTGLRGGGGRKLNPVRVFRHAIGANKYGLKRASRISPLELDV